MASYLVFAAVLTTALALPQSPHNTAAPTAHNSTSTENTLYDTITNLSRQCPGEKPYIVCYTICIVFRNFEIVDKDGHYVESKLVEYIAKSEELNQEQKAQVAEAARACRSENPSWVGCQGAREVFKCISDRNSKVTGEQVTTSPANAPKNRGVEEA